jgi:chromosome segregation ATPase
MGDEESSVRDGEAGESSEIAETREYLAKVERELALREETLEANLREQEELKRRLQSVNLERGLRRGRVDQLQAIDTYRREVARQLKRLQSRAEVLIADVRRARERRDVVLEELEELVGAKG